LRDLIVMLLPFDALAPTENIEVIARRLLCQTILPCHFNRLQGPIRGRHARSCSTNGSMQTCTTRGGVRSCDGFTEAPMQTETERSVVEGSSPGDFVAGARWWVRVGPGAFMALSSSSSAGS
jgi:hypothetical protein